MFHYEIFKFSNKPSIIYDNSDVIETNYSLNKRNQKANSKK